MDKKIIIAAGGTGGHLYPGLALARVLRGKGCEVMFVVRENDIGKDVLVSESFSFREIPVCGFPRKVSPEVIKFVLDLIRGFFAAQRIISEFKPAVVFGMGGYVSFPVIVASKLSKIRTVIHESNFLPGLSNRFLSRIADIVAVSFEQSAKYFPISKVLVSGNPVRKELFEAPYSEALKALGLKPGRFTVLVFGGSQGASKLNRAVIESWEKLKDLAKKIQFVHVTGSKDFARIGEEYKRNNIPGSVFAYLNNIGNAYEAADLVISRAGAMTVAELQVLNKPAILIPFPFATANHQEPNARVLEKEGKAKVILEKNLSAGVLAQEIRNEVKNFSRHKKEIKMPSVLPQDILADLVFKAG